MCIIGYFTHILVVCTAETEMEVSNPNIIDLALKLKIPNTQQSITINQRYHDL